VNAPGTVHFAGDTRIPTGRGIDGDVAVLGGPVVVAGRVSGDLVVVNGDVEFQEGAVVGGDVLVVGGSIEGADRARVGGEIRAYRDPLRYRREGDAIVYAPRRGPGDGEWAWTRRVSWSGRGSRTGFLVAAGGTYNRFEGLPIIFGPGADLRLAGDARLQVETRAIFRTGGDLSFNTGDFGHSIKSELVLGGRESNLGLGGRLYDVVASVEPWPLRDFEVGWSAFLLHRDYRDYYRRHGGSLYATLRITRQFQLGGEARDERHFSLQVRDPWTLFRNSQEWRANPEVDAGRYRSAIGSIKLDTRNDRTAPTSGWYLVGEFETALGTDLGFGLCPPTARCLAIYAPADSEVNYRRVMVDLRRYNRISPAGRVNFRGIAAGWVGGDPLPLQRRLSLGFPDPMPGLRMRQLTCGGEGVSGGALDAVRPPAGRPGGVPHPSRLRLRSGLGERHGGRRVRAVPRERSRSGGLR
jgi:hypothetical protein